MKLPNLNLQRGQVILVAALLLPVILGMAGLAVDIGSYAAERRSMQNAADSIALAAGQDLPDEAAALASADSWMAKTDVDPSEVTVTVSGGSVTPQVRVVIERPHEFVFMRVLGIDQRDVGAAATAAKYSPGAGQGIVPWSITQATVDASASGDEVVIKYDATGGSNGNFGAIRIDGNGASDYEDSAKYGASTLICTTSTPNCSTANCPGAFPATCAENSPECDGPECPPKTGNMTGPTRDAVDFRTGHTSTECDTFDEAFDPVAASLTSGVELRYALANTGHARFGGYQPAPPLAKKTDTPTSTPVTPTATPAGATATPTPASGTPTPRPSATPSGSGGSGSTYAINPECNPWSGGACPPAPATDDCSRRIFLIPIIDGFGNGSSDPVTILGFALVFLEGYDGGNCSGNSCEIRARFVQAELTTNSFAGDYDPDSLVHFVKLIE